MKALIPGAMLCTLAAAQAGELPDSWIARSSPPGVRFATGDAERSLAGASEVPGFSWESSEGTAWRQLDDGAWKPFDGGEPRERGGDDLSECDLASAAPEPSTFQLLALGAGMLGLLRIIRRVTR